MTMSERQRSPWSAAITAALLLFSAAVPLAAARAQQNPELLAKTGTASVEDTLLPLKPGGFRLGPGFLGDRYHANRRERMMQVDENDLLDTFERRDADHQVWQGEHAGKFLHAATLTWAATGDRALKAKSERVVRRLLKTQGEDGYLGAYPDAIRWTAWDVWVHKYNILGLLTWYQYTGDRAALDACRRAGDLLVRTFGPGGRDLNKAGEHVGMAATSVLEPIVLLYRATGDARYLAFARHVVAGYDAPGGPAVLSTLEKTGRADRVANAKAYEMLSNLNGLLELYRVTGDRRLRDAVETAWRDITAKRLYITGTASAGEFFRDDHVLPNGESHNVGETCVTVTWQQLNMHLLRLTGEARYAEEIERTACNHLAGAQKPTCDQWCYYTALEGRKPYGNNTTCCLSSGPRGIALLPMAAVMAGKDGGLAVNLYNTGSVDTVLPSGKVRLDITTKYPIDGRVDIVVRPERDARFPLSLRIPAWADGARVTVNGAVVDGVRPGAYAVIRREWHGGDTVRLDFPIRARVVEGDHGNEGRAAVLWGPLVLALDTGLNPGIRMLKQAALRSDGGSLPGSLAKGPEGYPVFTTEGTVGASPEAVPLRLTPFATAGADGESRYAVWIARPGRAETGSGSGSLLYGGKVTFTRPGNQTGDIADDDPATFRVTWNQARETEDWYAVSVREPVLINRVVYVHGKVYHDGGWFDTSAGKPRIEVRERPDGPWVKVATLDTYPATTATDAAGLPDFQSFTAAFEPVQVVAVRVVGAPAHGDVPSQNFSSCAELQAFGPGR